MIDKSRSAVDIGQDILEAINAINTNIEVREGKKDQKEAIDPKQSGLFDGLKGSGYDVLNDIFGAGAFGGK